MSKKALILTAIVLIFSACQIQAAVIDSNWVGPDGGFWSDANNWDPNIVPDNDGNTFGVTIDAGDGDIEVELQQDRTINQLDCNGHVELFGNDLVLTLVNDVNGLRNYGNLEISGEFEILGNATNFDYLELAEVELVGNVTNTSGAKLEFEHPGSEINGNLYNLAGGRVRVGSFAEIKQGDTENAGNIVICPLGQMMFENHFRNIGEIQLMGGSLLYWAEENGPGVLDNNSPGLITGFGIVDANQLPQNKGTIYASRGPLLLRSNGSVTNTGTLKNNVGATLHIQLASDVNNQGTIEINAGGGVAFDCNLVNVADVNLLGGTLSATTITQTADANFTGFGSITGNVIIDPNGIIELTGPTNIVGDVNIAANATLEISDGTTLVTGYTTNNGTIHMKGGYIIPQGGFTNNGSIIWESGTYTNVADFNLDGQVNFKDFSDFADTWLWKSDLYNP